MRNKTRTLTVWLWGEEVGKLTWNTVQNLASFKYSLEFLKGNRDIAPLTAPIASKRARLPILGREEPKYQKLPAFLADSLPDDWGNELFERWRIKQKITGMHITPLDKLSFIGQRAMGAFEFVPDSGMKSDQQDIDLQALIELAQRIFTAREDAHIGADEDLTWQSLIAVGTSAGGRQPKAILAIHPETHEIRSGQIAGLEGFEYHLLKFGDAQRSSAEIEMTYYEMARLAGIDMMPSKLIEVEGKMHFLTQRFDRQNGEKLHTQTLAALYPGANSYEMLLEVCLKIRLTAKEMEEVFRRLVFNILANNTDDHDKNFTFVMNPQGQWSLAPAYDVTFIFNTGGFQPETEHCLMARGKRADWTKDDLFDFASENGIRMPESIIMEVVQAVTSFDTLATKYGVKEQWKSRIHRCLTEHLQAWGYESEDEQIEQWSWDCGEHHISHPHLEQAFKENLDLTAEVDGKKKKYIIRQKTEAYTEMMRHGIEQLNREAAQALIERLLLPTEAEPEEQAKQ